MRVLGNGDKCCEAPTDFAVFEDFVTNHPVLDAFDSRNDARVELEYECAG